MIIPASAISAFSLATNRAKLLAALGEVFRERGYEGASLALITEATGLGKGSLYHAFPGGKEEMLVAVLAEIDAWFESALFTPLATASDPAHAVAAMFDATEAYFRSGRRVCLVGAVALGDSRDRFAGPVGRYFARWVAVLGTALTRAGAPAPDQLAEDIVAGIQGAIVLARATGDPGAFTRVIAGLRARVRLW